MNDEIIFSKLPEALEKLKYRSSGYREHMKCMYCDYKKVYYVPEGTNRSDFLKKQIDEDGHDCRKVHDYKKEAYELIEKLKKVLELI